MRLFLVNGSPTGVITAELGNWSGKAVVAPRTALPELIRREEAARCGVYILLGADPDNQTKTLVYVGEGDRVITRLQAHDDDDDKQFFTRVCIVVSKDENLTKAHGRYLEARIMALIREAGRAVLVNGTNPNPNGLLPEAERADMERFLSEIEVLLPVLGFDILRRTAERGDANAESDVAEPIFTFAEAGTKAHGIEGDGEFVVLANSLARVRETDSIPERTKDLRRRLIDEGILAITEDGQHYRFERDFPFDSPSSAASVLYGGNIGGPATWKREDDGLLYRAYRKQRLIRAQEDAG